MTIGLTLRRTGASPTSTPVIKRLSLFGAALAFLGALTRLLTTSAFALVPALPA